MRGDLKLMLYIIIVVVASQLHLSWGVCNVYDNPSSMEVHRCRIVEEMFEEGLTSNEDNLFILRDAFMSNSHPPPNLLLVTYNSYIPNSSSQHLQLFYNTTIPWSNSRLFTIIHPEILKMFQSGIVTLFYYLVRILDTPNIALFLIIIDKGNVKPSTSEIEYALTTITEKVNRQ